LLGLLIARSTAGAAERTKQQAGHWKAQTAQGNAQPKRDLR
jgi:hypothetical protein